MWFKNMQLTRLTNQWAITEASLEALLEKQAFHGAASLEMERTGWVPSFKGGPLAHRVEHQYLLTLRTEKKLLPGSVINQFVRAKAEELEEQQGFKPGRKQMRELKEQVTDELLPRAFGIHRDTRVWLDLDNRFLVVDAASTGAADQVRSALLKATDIPLGSLELNHPPVAVMTSWLSANEAPSNLTIDQDVELRSNANEKAAVRYVHHPLDGEDIRQHIEGGKRSTKLAMTWKDRISFVLTEDFTIKRIAPLDILKDAADPAEGEAERFDADFRLMSGELANLLKDLIEAIGGERVADLAA
ncbi:recombination-associated protein RdgC [Pandoraea communis]|uniref:recombination-associated protein RdgC n=1 Tax=Pandoraea communis TaxID=2508297 RepID=UPI0025A58973|nr:recombination-associated protein RdgC [Pandoraea communis]MDM8356580.1 recombination-associated protein RdgC [Pandoraea communis]